MATASSTVALQPTPALIHTPQLVCKPNYMVIICLDILFLSLDSKLLQGVVLPHENVYTLPSIVMLNWQIQALKAL